ncbi:MAG: hypothetical protein II902_05410, partial [Selenomonadaceae bacterium]|nr:hypothetical protein [Selenomonadaceae bacterium]
MRLPAARCCPLRRHHVFAAGEAVVHDGLKFVYQSLKNFSRTNRRRGGSKNFLRLNLRRGGSKIFYVGIFGEAAQKIFHGRIFDEAVQKIFHGR